MSIKVIQLKPCPFCGGEAKLEKMGWPHHVYCLSCGAKVTSTDTGIDGEVDACTKWNRRIIDKPVSMPNDMYEECQAWFREHTRREPTYEDCEKWQKRERAWYMERLKCTSTKTRETEFEEMERMAEEFYVPLTPELRQAANHSIDVCLDALNTCENNVLVSACRIAYQASRNLLNALPDGYPIPVTRREE